MSSAPWLATRDQPLPDDVDRLLDTLPEWFGIAEANAGFVDAARTMETWSVRDSAGRVVGVTLVDRHFPHVAEIYLIVVDRELHGSGVGTALVDATLALGKSGVPLLAINSLRAQTEKDEQTGLANLVKGLNGLYRNPTAHDPRLNRTINDDERLEVLTIVSMIQRRLDGVPGPNGGSS